MPKILINGFVIEKPGSIVRIAVQLIENSSNEVQSIVDNNQVINADGFVEIMISNKYKGRSVNIIYLGHCFKYRVFPCEVDHLGVYFTLPLEIDDTYISEKNDCIEEKKQRYNLSTIYSEASKKMLKKHREAKTINWILTIITIILTFCSSIAGYYFQGILGIGLGLILGVAVFIIAPYQLGYVSFPRVFRK